MHVQFCPICASFVPSGQQASAAAAGISLCHIVGSVLYYVCSMFCKNVRHRHPLSNFGPHASHLGLITAWVPPPARRRRRRRRRRSARLNRRLSSIRRVASAASCWSTRCFHARIDLCYCGVFSHESYGLTGKWRSRTGSPVITPLYCHGAMGWEL